MKIINFSHPLTEDNLDEIVNIVKESITDVIEVPNQIDQNEFLEEQISSWLDNLKFSSHQWQTEALLINPPSLNHSAVVVISQLHGRMGYFPSVIRIVPNNGKLPPRFKVLEIMNLQAIRERARAKR